MIFCGRNAYSQLRQIFMFQICYQLNNLLNSCVLDRSSFKFINASIYEVINRSLDFRFQY